MISATAQASTCYNGAVIVFAKGSDIMPVSPLAMDQLNNPQSHHIKQHQFVPGKATVFQHLMLHTLLQASSNPPITKLLLKLRSKNKNPESRIPMRFSGFPFGARDGT